MSEVRFDAELIRRYGGRGPRYTSYPTAPHFHGGYGEAQYRRDALATNRDPVPAPLSLYLHLPFCRELCYYCGCTKLVTRNDARTGRYLDALQREAALQGELYDGQRRVEQVHLGGGTPTYYSDGQLAELTGALRAAFTFAPADDLQCSIEVDPRTVGPERLGALAELGFNRLSLGVQDFDRHVQVAVNRVQSFESTRDLVVAAREQGFRSVSIDLIYGLPLQETGRFGKTLDKVAALRPDRISLYSYAHLPQLFRAQKLIPAGQLPDDREKLALLELSIRALGDAGYEYIGMDHFALATDELVEAQRTGHLQRNFQGYSTHRHCDLVALGASAIGQVGDSFYQHGKNTNVYCAAIERGQLPIERGLARSEDDRIRADLIQELMCQGEVDFAEFEQRHGIRFDDYFLAELADLPPLEADDLLRLDADRLTVRPRGRLLLRAIAMVFDRYLREQAAQPRYSKVI